MPALKNCRLYLGEKMMKILSTMALAGTLLYGGGDMLSKISELTEPQNNDSKIYVGFGIGAANLNSYIYDKESVSEMSVKIGYDFYDYMGLELRASTGLSDGDYLGHDYSYGIYIKPQYMVNDVFKIYALLGYAETKITLNEEVAASKGVSPVTTQSGFSYGVGLDYTIDDTWSVYAEMMNMVDESTVIQNEQYATKVDTFTIGVGYHF